MRKIISAIFIIGLLTIFASAQTTAFNFQGRLNDGSSPANGKYDLQFRLYDSITGGVQVGATIPKANLTLVNGVFSTQLDFGAAAFDGGDRFIEIGLRQTATGGNPPNAYVVLGPRQQILSVPYTIRSSRATLADNSTTSNNSLNLGGVAASNYVQQDNSGNVGIGGNNSNYKLYVNGNVRITGNQTLDGSSLTGGNSTVNGNSEVGGTLKTLGNSEIGGNLKVSGSTTQPFAANGLPKAMLRINANGTILRCYNGITGNGSGNCGFTVDHFTTGGYGIDFGFGTDGSFVSLAVEYDRANSEFVAANYSASAFFNHLDVYTFSFPNAFPTAPYDRPFTIILY